MRTGIIAATAAASLLAGVAPEKAEAKLSKREFCAVMSYCRIPWQYRSGPFLAPPLVREATLNEIQKHCSGSGHAKRPFGASSYILGCAQLKDGNCLVYLPKELRAISKDAFDMVRIHELAHCRGWSHTR